MATVIGSAARIFLPLAWTDPQTQGGRFQTLSMNVRAQEGAMPMAWMMVAKVHLKDPMRDYEEALRARGTSFSRQVSIPFCWPTVALPWGDFFVFGTPSAGTGLFGARGMMFTVPVPFQILDWFSQDATLADVSTNPWTVTSPSIAAPPSGTTKLVHALGTLYALIPESAPYQYFNSTTGTWKTVPGTLPVVNEWTGSTWAADTTLNAAIAHIFNSSNSNTTGQAALSGGFIRWPWRQRSTRRTRTRGQTSAIRYRGDSNVFGG